MIIGRLGADPEVRYTQNNTALANIRVATNEKYRDSNGELQETTEWHRVVAWGRLAENCQQLLKKGSLVYFEGPIQTRSWEDKDGQKQYMTEIKALNMQVLDSRMDSGGGYESARKEELSVNDAKEFEPGDGADQDDDLPF